MSAYPTAPTLVLRSGEPRTESHTQFEVTAVPYPGNGAGECPECRAGGRTSQAIGEVRYRSSVFRSRQHDAVCLPCLPGLLGILARLHENPLTVALYSPTAGDRSDRVLELNAEREDLVVQLVAATGLEKVTEMLQQNYAAASAQLRRIAEVA